MSIEPVDPAVEFSREYSTFVRSRTKQFNSFAFDFLHAAVGMVGEARELADAASRAEIKEELGDFEFYFEALCQLPWPRDLYQLAVHDVKLPCPIHFTQDGLCAESGILLDLAKKVWVYEQDIRLDQRKMQDVEASMYDIRACLNTLYERLEYSYDEARADNMEKLRKRYPDGYSNEAAQARADKEV